MTSLLFSGQAAERIPVPETVFPATGKRLEVQGITIFRIVDGKIVEEWNSIDELGLMRQLGMLS
jgi:predicted ester cyclase